MKYTLIHRFHLLFLFFILASPFSLIAMNVDEYTSYDFMQDDYIFLNNESYNISDFVFQVSEFDNDFESPLHILKKYILNGFLIGLKDEILQVLGYAEWLLEQENIVIDYKQRKQLLLTVDDLVGAIASEKLAVDFNNQYKKLPLKVINKKLHVKGKTRLFSDFIVAGKARFHKPVRFYKRVHFKDGIRVNGTASLQDVVIANCIEDLCVQNLSIVDAAIDNLTVTNCIEDLCVQNLSVVDGSISGTLSVEDLVVQTLEISDLTLVDVTFTTASITDAVIANLTVTNCVSDLCVEDISIVDGSISGTLSVNDIVIESLTPAGVVHNDASGNLSSSLIVNADVAPAAGIVDTKLATISTAGKVANSATTATSSNVANTIVARDASGNFTTHMITITGVVTNPTDVATKAYVDSSISATGTNLNTPNTLVRRDGTGSFAAQTISLVDEVATGSITVTPFSTAGVVHNDASGLLSSSLIVNADVAPAAGIVDTKLATISTAGKVANSATTATSSNVANTIVARDASGNFTTNMITITGVVTNPTDVATKAYVDSSISATGTNLNTPNTLVRRDNTGSFAAQTISLVDEVISGNISMSDSTSATVGNIVKNGNRFIHNFGTNNTFVGVNAGNFTMSGTGVNTALGSSALSANTTGSNNTAVGFNALTANTIGQTNTAIGSSALAANTTGNNNVAVGSAALILNTIGIRNIAIGFSSLGANTTGQLNVAVGHQTLFSNVTGVQNTAVGDGALLNNTAAGNTGIGANALLGNTTGFANTAIGIDALSSNTTGSSNTAVGANALQNSTVGVENVAVGESCLFNSITGTQNTAMGRLTGFSVTTGSNNVLLGFDVGASLTTGNNNIYINGAGLNPANESDTIRIGSTQTTCFIQGISGVTTGLPGVTVLVDANGQLGTISSSRTFKNDIKDLNEISENIYKLRPVSFVYNVDTTKTIQFGLIAEEVDKVFPNLVVRDKSGSVYTVRYEILPVLLLNEMQKQKIDFDQQREDIKVLKQIVLKLQERVQNFLH